MVETTIQRDDKGNPVAITYHCVAAVELGESQHVTVSTEVAGDFEDGEDVVIMSRTADGIVTYDFAADAELTAQIEDL